MKDYYKILEVNNSASDEVISKVYRMLAKKYHPDSNPDNKQEAEAKFKEISEAYEILSNEQKRKDYDAELEEYKKSQSQVTIPEDYEYLKSHVAELENQLYYMQTQQTNSSQEYESTNNTSNNTNNNTQNYQNTQNFQNIANKAYQDAMNKAYQDSYYNTLRNLGYKIHYKKTAKEQIRSFLTTIISLGLTILILYIAWQIPSFRESIKSFLMLK